MMIPALVRISGVDYEVHLTESPVIVEGRQCFGSIEYEQNRINIDVSIGSVERHMQTLIHEILHGIGRDRDIDFGNADEEEIVEAFARGLYQVIADNPSMFSRGDGPCCSTGCCDEDDSVCYSCKECDTE